MRKLTPATTCAPVTGPAAAELSLLVRCAIALAIVGFSWGGWVTGGTAKQMASEQARLEVVAALVPICIEQSSQDPQLAQKLAQLEDASNYQRSDMLMKTGWATMPGASDPNRQVASACMEQLAAQF